LQNIKEAQGILFTGSRATGMFSLNSDWDFIILLSDGQKGYRKTWEIDGELVEIFCHPKQELDEFLRTDPLVRIGATTNMLASGIILKDNPKRDFAMIVKRAKNIWKKGPQPVGKIERQWIGYDISTYLEDVEDCVADNNPAYLLFSQAVSEMVRYFYALSRIWLPLPKKRLNDLKKRIPALYALVIKFHTSSEWKQKAEIITNLGVMLAKHFKLNIDGKLPAQKN